MSRYVEKHLYENELIVEKANRDKWGLIGRWIFGILCFWMLLIPLISAIKHTVIYTHTELVLTNKRIIRKSGVFRTTAFDAPLDKILNVYVVTTFWGRIFNSNRIYIATEHGVIVDKLANADEFKGIILGQIDHLQESRLALQATWTAQAMVKSRARYAAEQEERVGKRRGKSRDDFEEYDFE